MIVTGNCTSILNAKVAFKIMLSHYSDKRLVVIWLPGRQQQTWNVLQVLD